MPDGSAQNQTLCRLWRHRKGTGFDTIRGATKRSFGRRATRSDELPTRKHGRKEHQAKRLYQSRGQSWDATQLKSRISLHHSMRILSFFILSYLVLLSCLVWLETECRYLLLQEKRSELGEKLASGPYCIGCQVSTCVWIRNPASVFTILTNPHGWELLQRGYYVVATSCR